MHKSPLALKEDTNSHKQIIRNSNFKTARQNYLPHVYCSSHAWPISGVLNRHLNAQNALVIIRVTENSK